MTTRQLSDYEKYKLGIMIYLGVVEYDDATDTFKVSDVDLDDDTMIQWNFRTPRRLKARVYQMCAIIDVEPAEFLRKAAENQLTAQWNALGGEPREGE